MDKFRTTATAGRRAGKSCFTLLELLLVITVIAILAAITFPSLIRARVMAQQTFCANNIRQIAQLCAMYRNDNNMFPVS